MFTNSLIFLSLAFNLLLAYSSLCFDLFISLIKSTCLHNASNIVTYEDTVGLLFEYVDNPIDAEELSSLALSFNSTVKQSFLSTIRMDTLVCMSYSIYRVSICFFFGSIDSMLFSGLIK